eukprot:8435754-Alexandrium_andersonii.AAC.1
MSASLVGSEMCIRDRAYDGGTMRATPSASPRRRGYPFSHRIPNTTRAPSGGQEMWITALPRW